jgi:feruloyl esterase
MTPLFRRAASLLPLAGTLAGCSGVGAPAAPVACDALAAVAPPGVSITRAEARPAAGADPAHCLVQGRTHERTGTDGRRYAIGFEMRLPQPWNGRFLHQVNGGNDGVVLPATGALAVLERSALQRGFAVLSSDSGHDAGDPANAALGLTRSNVFGLDPQARRDYGYSADPVMAVLGKTLVQRHYGQPAARSYLAGCSNGGRHALVAATRDPQQYDGILAGAPGLNLPKAAVQHAWDVQSWRSVDPDIRKAFSPADLKLVAAKVLERCDALDGLADGLVNDLRGCQKAFRLVELQCAGEKTAECLSAPQVGALERSFAGPRNRSGEALYSDWSFDAGIASANWRMWKLESPIAAWERHPTIAVMGGGSLAYIFSTPPVPVGGTPAALLDFLSRFDFDRDAPLIAARDANYAESAMEFMTPPDVNDPKLAAFGSRGAKLIVYHGATDPVFSVNDTIRWHERLLANGGGAFARLYVVPGMAHCNGGPATDRFDALGALVDWVEKGAVPDRLVAGVTPANTEVPADWSKGRTRPLCAWPAQARYMGGDKEAASSFRCEAPR